MREAEIVEYVKNMIKENERSISWTARKIGYLPETLSHWLSGKTHMTINGLFEVCKVFHRRPMIKMYGVYYDDFLGVLAEIWKNHYNEVCALFKSEKHAKQNVAWWISEKHGMRLSYLILILDVVGAEIVICNDM